MYCQLLSDLHLEFNEFSIINTKLNAETVLILAGDIGNFRTKNSQHRLLKLIRDACSKFREVIYVSGNHEYYGGGIDEVNEILKNLDVNIKNFHYLNNSKVTIDDVTFIGGTLWTSFNNKNQKDMYLAKTSMADYANIKDISPDIIYKLHEECRDFIFRTVEEENEKLNKTVVVTHHSPTKYSIHTKYKDSHLNSAFSSNLKTKIRKSKPNVWCHGHTHESFIYSLHDTMIYCNPLGYTNFEYNGLFNPLFRFEV